MVGGWWCVVHGCAKVDRSNDGDSDCLFTAVRRFARCLTGRGYGGECGICGGKAEGRKTVHVGVMAMLVVIIRCSIESSLYLDVVYDKRVPPDSEVGRVG